MRSLVLAVAVALLVQQTMAASPSDLVSKPSNHFAMKLYQELAKEPGNFLFCPLSLHLALTLIHQGARGSSAEELAKVLSLPGNASEINNSYKVLLEEDKNFKHVIQIVARLFPAIDFTPKKDYVASAQQCFLSDVQPLDYKNAAKAADTINKYVEDNTDHKIKDFVKPDLLSAATKLVVVNAIHFKAEWAKIFPPAVDDFFKVTPSEKVKTKFVKQVALFEYKEDSKLGAKMLKMDYKEGPFSMIFVLPDKEDGLSALEHKLANHNADDLFNGMASVVVGVTIPEYKIEKDLKLSKTLEKMGIKKIFAHDADLSGISGNKDLYVGHVLQKVFISVDRKGTEATAATGVIVAANAVAQKEFKADHPFIFYLRNDKTGAILFTGRFARP